jgi:N-terminal domain on NACHT_NTPase and P-loop NTPases
MDGLSAAASGIAVVSLAIQLVESVREMRRFLRSVSEAPEELKRLLDLLEQLELILEQVGMLIQQQGNARLEASSVMASVMRAINTCESKLAMLEGIVEVTKQASAKSSRVTKTMGSFRLACKKKDIREIEKQLYDAVTLLGLSMMANLT